jgi:hypothetical protein
MRPHARPRVGSEHDVRVGHREERVEVAVARGSQEGVHDFSLAGAIGDLWKIVAGAGEQPLAAE